MDEATGLIMDIPSDHLVSIASPRKVLEVARIFASEKMAKDISVKVLQTSWGKIQQRFAIERKPEAKMFWIFGYGCFDLF